MADRALRGVGLGAKSFEDEQGIEFAGRQKVAFDCPKGHHFEVAFALEAELPTEWECKKCGSISVRSDGSVGEEKKTKPLRTHWDMLRERRSIPELEDILAEQLDKLRESDDPY
ncbi:MAG: RNA polymerase-binding protein RbpA [Propionibacteriaceae bacterium]|nr:RNA polymerase-binding protein RbpA [Propionibacteriaceae bacterium]